MARLARLSRPGLPHCIVQRGHNRQAIVTDDEDRAAWRAILGEEVAARGVALHAWALQDDAFHLVCTPAQPGDASRLLQALGRRYVAAFNRRHGRTGTLWEGRFRSCVVEPGRALLDCMRWVDGLGRGVSDDAQAPASAWSSLAHHLGQRADLLLSDPPEYWALGNTPFEREAAWRRLLDAGLPAADAQRISDAVRRGWPLGSEAFVQALEAATGQPARPRRRGRPAGRKLASGG